MIIIDDLLAEGVEQFCGELVVSGPDITDFSIKTKIEILDDEGIYKLLNSSILYYYCSE